MAINTTDFTHAKALLFDACKKGNIEVVNQILAVHYPLINERDEDTDTLIHHAATEGHASLVSYLITRRANPDVSGCSARTPLHCAAYEGHVECVKVLLQHGAELDWIDSLEENPLHKAALRGHTECLALLLEHKPGIDVINLQNVLGSSPLHQAMEHGNEECAKLLLTHNANPSIKDYFGYVPTFQPKQIPRKF